MSTFSHMDFPKKNQKIHMGNSGYEWDFMGIHGILWDFFVVPGSLDITEHVPQLSLEISHNFPNFWKNLVKFGP